jgi:hypothetical protein
VHAIVDNYATHKHPRVKRWLAARPRFQVHFTPTYASWLNQVEIWFHWITRQAIQRGTFGSVKELVLRIDRFVHTHYASARPFAWTATADSILAKLQRLCERISGTEHQLEAVIFGRLRSRLLQSAVGHVLRRRRRTGSNLDHYPSGTDVFIVHLSPRMLLKARLRGVQALREMRRVCRPRGHILLLEHGRSSRPSIAMRHDGQLTWVAGGIVSH